MMLCNEQVLQACMYNSMPRDLVEVNCSGHKEMKLLGNNKLFFLKGPFARVEKREDQLEVFLKYAGLFGVPEVQDKISRMSNRM